MKDQHALIILFMVCPPLKTHLTQINKFYFKISLFIFSYAEA